MQTARFVVMEEVQELNSFVICLYEHADGSGERMEFQRALVFDRQDIEAGMDTYCIVTDSGASHYGGVLWWRLDSMLSIRLDAKAAATLGVGEKVSVTLAIDRASLIQLEAGLIRIFGAKPQ